MGDAIAEGVEFFTNWAIQDIPVNVMRMVLYRRAPHRIHPWFLHPTMYEATTSSLALIEVQHPTQRPRSSIGQGHW